jgi:hypothetical protein
MADFHPRLPVCLQLKSSLSSPGIKNDFTLIVNGHKFPFPHSVLSASCGVISTLLLCDPLSTSFEIDDGFILDESLEVLTASSVKITDDSVIGVVRLAIHLASDGLFTSAVLSRSFLSVSPAQVEPLLALALKSGLDLRPLLSVSFPSGVLPGVAIPAIHLSSRSPLLEGRQAASAALLLGLGWRGSAPAPFDCVGRITFEAASPFSGILGTFLSVTEFSASSRFSLIVKVGDDIRVRPTDCCVRCSGLPHWLDLCILEGQRWQPLRNGAVTPLSETVYHFRVDGAVAGDCFGLLSDAGVSAIELFGDFFRNPPPPPPPPRPPSPPPPPAPEEDDIDEDSVSSDESW